MKALLQSKKFIVALVAIAAISGGLFMIESKAGNEIASRIEEQLTIIGCTFTSVEVSPIGQSLEIKDLKLKKEYEDEEFFFTSEKIILTDISFDALDEEAGDYPLVAESIQIINSTFHFADDFFSLDMEIDEYSIDNWSQNIALLVAASEHGYASVDFLERAFTYKFDNHQTKGMNLVTTIKDDLDVAKASIFIENANSVWNADNTLASSMDNFNLTIDLDAKDTMQISASLESAKANSPVYFISPRGLALLTHLAITNPDDSMAEDLLYDLLLDEENQGEGMVFDFTTKDFSLDIDKTNYLTNASSSLSTKQDSNTFAIEVQDLDFKQAFYEDLFADSYPFLQAMNMHETSLDASLEVQLLDDDISLSIAQDMSIDNLFDLEIASVIEMLYPITQDLDNTPNKFSSFAFSYEDKGFIPRSNLAIQNLFSTDIVGASSLQSTTIKALASFVPDLEVAVDKLFTNLGRIDVKLNESVGIFDLLFIPPSSLNSLFTIHYTPSKDTLEQAIKKL